ncbi:MAG: hypothetical protein KBB52_06270 [Candidatus Omnitrophica bacterium]|nr:hypothetical protein [Candidatus Omnitrophota bacterium]
MKNIALIVAGMIFLVVSLVHLSRLVLRVEVKVGNFTVPVWLSIICILGPLGLALWMFASAR